MTDKLIFAEVSEEQDQGHSTRKRLYLNLEKRLKTPLVTFFTSFKYPVTINDGDANLLEGLLQKCDLTEGLTLMLSSPGGDALAAERIINICRSYSNTGKYQVIVAGKAKSAATMICLGASKLLMNETSELGPIDPQVIDYKEQKRFSVYNIVKSYEELFKKAVKEKGNLEPYIQQLSRYDAREIQEYKMALSLSEDVAIKALKTGMLSKKLNRDIKKKITIFLTPKTVKTHGRPICYDEASKCGLQIEKLV